ncbi:GNAT family N-acetyltransferase [Streptomyces sp. WMMC897]|uniref:GNAT family N-acetyltransferase n=1 Tax=Streptomyces sp. WMMC897 TaxID=3014782 RepID=UPI0022B677E6|nr:GNAT family N-acetyltransferase [Streptomyces sp. WMMC897]MCZ7417691.1 GNAT family N-acetyltransferase [Streptomyces sp. WMMC897]
MPEDLTTVEGLLTGASEWLASRGIDQWQYPPHRDRIQAAIEAGTVYLIERVPGGEAVATLQLDGFADPEFWGPGDDPGEALYVHRMAVRRSAAGEGLGDGMLDWAAERAAREGKRWLRLDAWKDNAGLHAFYKRAGFHIVRIVDLPHRRSGALFQRAV